MHLVLLLYGGQTQLCIQTRRKEERRISIWWIGTRVPLFSFWNYTNVDCVTRQSQTTEMWLSSTLATRVGIEVNRIAPYETPGVPPIRVSLG